MSIEFLRKSKDVFRIDQTDNFNPTPQPPKSNQKCTDAKNQLSSDIKGFSIDVNDKGAAKVVAKKLAEMLKQYTLDKSQAALDTDTLIETLLMQDSSHSEFSVYICDGTTNGLTGLIRYYTSDLDGGGTHFGVISPHGDSYPGIQKVINNIVDAVLNDCSQLPDQSVSEIQIHNW